MATEVVIVVAVAVQNGALLRTGPNELELYG